MHRVAKFYRWMILLRHPLTVSYALVTLALAAMGTYFAYQATAPHLEDYLGKWYGYYEWINSDGSRTQIIGDTHFFANGHYNYSGSLKIVADEKNSALFHLSGAGEWQGDTTRLTIRLTSLTAKMVAPSSITLSDIADLEHNITTLLQNRSGDYQVQKLDHHQMILTALSPVGDILTVTQQKRSFL